MRTEFVVNEPAAAALSYDHPVWKALKDLDVISYRPELVVTTGSLATGVLLSQMLYWFGPDKKGKTKLRVFRAGRFWIAKSRRDWHLETALSEGQVQAAQERLVKLGIIEMKRFRFDGLVIGHVALNQQVLLDLLTNPPQPEEGSDLEALPSWEDAE